MKVTTIWGEMTLREPELSDQVTAYGFTIKLKRFPDYPTTHPSQFAMDLSRAMGEIIAERRKR